MSTADQVVFIQDHLRRAADPDKAGPMQAYMKTDMPFHGVQKTERVAIRRAFKRAFTLRSWEDDLRPLIEALWALPHREEKYLALELAHAHTRIALTQAALPLWEWLVRDGAWWDLVDAIASPLVSPTYLKHREEVEPWTERWIEDESLWVRRLAILAHLKHKEQTDAERLFAHCLRCAHEKEFFIRKAIGWALREYSKHDPEAVAAFLLAHRGAWSGLTFREGSKHLRKQGWEPGEGA